MAVIAKLAFVGALAGLSAFQSIRFSSETALWLAAVRETPHLPRPAFNLAVSYGFERPGWAAEWFVRSIEHARGTSEEARYRALVQDRLGMLTAFGSTVCNESGYRPYC